MPIFHKDHTNMSFHGNQTGDIVAILLLKHSIDIQNGTNGTFLVNSKFDYWILHKKLV